MIGILDMMRKWDRGLPDIALACSDLRAKFEVETGAARYDVDADHRRQRRYRFSFYVWARNRYALNG